MTSAGSIPLDSSRGHSVAESAEFVSPDVTPTPILSMEVVRALAREAGFTEAGVVSLPHASTDRDAGRFEEFIEAGRAGTMGYLARRNEQEELIRSRVDVPFPWARSIVVCLAGYNADAPLSIAPAAEGAGWIARYAWSGRLDKDGSLRPSDYHKVLLKRLRALESTLHGACGEFESRAYVDTGPVVERSVARAAGLGWTGKNTCLIHPKLGSWNFLAVIVTSLELPVEQVQLTVPDRCGSCTRCLDACPTDALIAPYQMDATRCISYLTIEHKGEISTELSAGMGRQIVGCDICQDVCPWNRKAPIGPDADGEMTARRELINPDLSWLAEMELPEFEKRFNGSPIRRTGFAGLRRNVAIAMGNSGLPRFLPILERWIANEAQDEVLQKTARWAMTRIVESRNAE
jgi:epoxyqueuosine reductase